MMRGAKTSALALLALIGSFSVLISSAAAQVAPPPVTGPTVQAFPPTANVSASRTATVSVTWQITNPVGSPPFTSIQSQNAILFAPGLSSDGYLISTPLTYGPLQEGQTARIHETMIIPQSVLMRVLQAGSRTITATRYFQGMTVQGQFVSLQGVMTIEITGSLGGQVQISRIDLRFQNEAVQIIVPQYHAPEVRADISYTGTGLFRAVWEVADPRVTAAGGPTIYRVLRQDRIRLGVGGLKRIRGPKLPAELTGLHVVRFRVLDGPLAGQAPIVRYFVKTAAPNGEDWWKRYIRPHSEGEGLVRVPTEPQTEEPVIEDQPASAPDGAAPTGDKGTDAKGTGDEKPATGEPGNDQPDAGKPDDETPSGDNGGGNGDTPQ